MANLEAKTKTKSNSKYTEDWIPIRNISNGMIVLDNKKKVTGVKIRPRNIFILEQGTQDNVLIALKNFYNMIDFESSATIHVHPYSLPFFYQINIP